MRARHAEADQPHSFPVAAWTAPRASESFARQSSLDHPSLFGLALAVLCLGFLINRFTLVAVDGMSLVLIFAKSWIVLLVGHACYYVLCLRLVDYVAPDTDIQRLLSQEEFQNAVPVQVKLRRRGVLTGMDYGLAWLDGKSLKFKGGATSFCVPRAVLLPWFLWTNRQKEYLRTSESVWKIPLLGIDESQSLTLKVIDHSATYASMRKSRIFVASLNGWLRDTSQMSTSGTRLPPTAVHPSLQTPTASVVKVLGSAVFVGLVDAVLMIVPSIPHQQTSAGLVDWYGRVLGAGLLVTTVAMAVRCYKSYVVRAWVADEG